MLPLNNSNYSTVGQMSDISAEQFERFISEMRGTTGALNKIIGKMDTKKSGTSSSQAKSKPRSSSIADELARKQLSRDMAVSRQTNKEKTDASRSFASSLSASSKMLSGSLRSLDASASQFGRTLISTTKTFAGFGVVGGIIESMIDLGEHWIDQYRELANVGQMFGGSMVDMAQEAAAARMPLAEFAAYVKKNSKVMASFGVKDVTQLAKSVRKASHNVGMYGYSVEGMNDLTASYLDTQRLLGNRTAAASATSTTAITNMAGEVAGLSGVFGKSREEIIAERKAFATSADVTLAQLKDGTLKTNATFQSMLTSLSALPDEAKGLQEGFASMMAYGTSQFTGMFKNANAWGGGAIDALMREISVDVRNQSIDSSEATARLLEGSNKIIEGHLGTIQLLAMQGDESAKQALAQFNATKGMDARQLRAKQKEAEVNDRFTKTMLTIGDRLQDLKGKLLEGVLEGFKTFLGVTGDIENSDAWKTLMENTKVFGTMLGQILADIAIWFSDKENINSFFEGLKMLTAGVITLGSWMVTLGTYTLQLVQFFQRVGHAIGSEKNGGLIGAFMSLGAFLTAKSFLKNLIGSTIRSMNVAAGSVFLNGKPLGGPMGLGGPAGSPRGKGLFGGLGSGLKGAGKAAMVGVLATGMIGLLGNMMSEAAAPETVDTDARRTADATEQMVDQNKEIIKGGKDQGNGAAAGNAVDANGVVKLVDKDGNQIESGSSNTDEQGNQAPTPATQVPPSQPTPRSFDPTTGQWVGIGAAGLGAVGMLGHRGLKGSQKMMHADARSALAARLRSQRAADAHLRELRRTTPEAGREAEHGSKINRAEAEANKARLKANEARANKNKWKSRIDAPGFAKRTMDWLGSHKFTKGLKSFGNARMGGRFGTALRLGAKGAKGLAGRIGVLAPLLESIGYMGADGKALTMKNLGKSALSLGGGALGGLLGSALGPAGTLIGGTGGYVGGQMLGDYLLGPDDMKKPASPAVQKAAEQKQMKRADQQPQPAAVAQQKDDLAESRKQTQLLESGLPTQSQQSKEASEVAEMLKTMKQTREINIAIYQRLVEHSNQFNSIWRRQQEIVAAIGTRP